MATTKLLLGIICFAFTGSFSMYHRHLLTQREGIVNLAAQELGVRERTGKNDGKRVETYLSLVGLHRGDPYCAAFVSFIFAKDGLAQPRSGWCPDLFPASRITKEPLPGNLIGIYFPDLGRIAHVGIIEQVHHDWCQSIEGNTNVSGSREGRGVYRRLRHMKTIYRMADWVSPGRKRL